MRRSMSRASIRSITDTFCRYKALEKVQGRKNVSERTEFYQTFVASEGHSKFRFVAKSVPVPGPLQYQIVNALHLGERDRAFNFLSILSRGNDPLRSDDFIYILDYCARSPDPLFVMETWRIMEEKQIDMNTECHRLIIEALTKGGYLEEAFNWLSFLGQSPQSFPDLCVYNTFLKGCVQMGSMVHVNSCLDLMENQMVGKSEVTYVQLLKMQKLGLEPSSQTYDGLIKAVVYERGVTNGLKLLKAMGEANLKPTYSTLGTLSIACSQLLELELAEALVDQIVKSSWRLPFNALLAAYDAMDQPERAVRLLAKMKQLKLKSDSRTYELLFCLFGNVNAPYEKGDTMSQVDAAKRINAIEMDMMKNGVQHSYLSMANLLRALGAEGMVRELTQYLRMAENQIFLTNPFQGTTVYNSALHSLVEAKESHMAIEVFKDMKLRDLPPDTVTYNIMIDCCGVLRCFKSACVFVSMMLRDGFSPQTCTYTTLIKILLENDGFDEALHLLYQVSLEGIQLDVVLFNTILQKANQKGQIDIIEFIVERMHQERIQPDPDTCTLVFRAYLRHGFLSTALEALQVLSMRMISEEESVLQENRKYFEDNFIFSEDSEFELRIIKIFKDSNEYLATALWNLRWCAVVGLSISWSPNQSEWAKQLSCSHDCKS